MKLGRGMGTWERVTLFSATLPQEPEKNGPKLGLQAFWKLIQRTGFVTYASPISTKLGNLAEIRESVWGESCHSEILKILR